MVIPPEQSARIASPRNSNAKVITSNDRLRAAASLSPFNKPSCMAVRASYGLDNNPTLAAIAGPMGITVVDVLTPQRPWLVLNYASTMHDSEGGFRSTVDGNVRGGITTMAFQPSRSESSYQTQDREEEYNQISSSILLATARGSGILIWDCSGRSLNPLLGRLNASDAWSGGIPNNRTTQSTKEEHEDVTQNQLPTRPPLPPAAAESTPSTDRKCSAISLSSNSSQGTSNAGVATSISAIDSSFNALPSSTAGAASKMSTASPVSGRSSSSQNAVKSLAWKGPHTPILLATAGPTACLFDLRTSLFSGVGDTSGGRPYARFSATDCNNTMIHCSYSHDESLHVFSTLDSTGVVCLWDDRKCSSLASADFCLSSFVAHTNTGVGIAAICPASDAGSSNSRWVTWGIDAPSNGFGKNDELVVKVWESLTDPLQQRRTATMSTVSADDDELDKSESECIAIDSFQMTSCTSMQGAVGARVHPLVPDELMLFRPQLDSIYNSNEIICPSPSLRGEAIAEDAGTVSTSPLRTKRQLASSLTSTPDTMLTPTISTTVVHEMTTHKQESEEKNKTGWDAQLLRVRKNSMEQITLIGGGGREEDALCLAPGHNDIDNKLRVIAVDLANSYKDMLLCILTENALKVYGLPELNITTTTSSAGLDIKNEVTQFNVPSSVARVYKQQPESASWWNQSEEDVFGDVQSTRMLSRVEDESLLRTSGRSMESPLPIAKNIANLIAPEKDLATDEGDLTITPAMNESETNVVVDLNRARRCPCPPLCGVAFGSGGKLVAFNNGQVKKMFSWYRESPGTKIHQSYNEGLVVFSEVTTATIDIVENSEKKSTEDVQSESGTPRTLFDLIEMQSAAKLAQWGDIPNPSNSDSSDDQSFDGSDDQSSDGSSADDASSDSDGFCHVGSTSRFDEYFGSSRKSLTQVDIADAAAAVDNRVISKQFTGITSLAPAVLVTGQYDGILLNGQSAKLAQLIELGAVWWLQPDFSTPTSWERSEKTTTTPRDETSHIQPTSERVYTNQQSQESSRSASILKKMFALQSPSASIPADQRLFKSKRQPIMPSLDLPEWKPVNSDSSEMVPLGIYVTENYQPPQTAFEQMALTRTLCLGNAKIMRDVGEKSKADSWVLLAQATQSAQAFLRDDFDGWGGYNDSLTTGLVEQLFRFYEAEGDFQMLASIVCVLTHGRDRRATKNQQYEFDKYMLLPQRSVKDQIRFDNYLRRYAHMLYSWGILTVGNEVSKRLAHSQAEAGGELSRVKGTYVCSAQCSICCSAVRGASIFCPLCGHGGHLEHIMNWFQRNQTCPTGCGCVCMTAKE